MLKGLFMEIIVRYWDRVIFFSWFWARDKLKSSDFKLMTFVCVFIARPLEPSFSQINTVSVGQIDYFSYCENYNYNMTALHSIALPPLPSFRMIPSFYRWLTTLEENSKTFIIDGGTQPISMTTYFSLAKLETIIFWFHFGSFSPIFRIVWIIFLMLPRCSGRWRILPPFV